MTVRRIAAALAVVAGMALAPWHTAIGQSLDFGSGKDGDTPIEVFADDGIEWQQDGQVFVARGNARAVRGNVSVDADELRAFYRSGAEGGTEIWRLHAVGNVTIASPSETVTGDKAVYDLDSAVIVVTGDGLRLDARGDSLTARDTLEYWVDRRLAVARGDATAVKEDKRLRADTMTAAFTENADGKTGISTVNALGNVVIVTPQESVSAERGVYDVKSGVVRLAGSVNITRGENQLAGCGATVNLNSGTSRLSSCGDAPGSRVRGLLVPQKEGQGQP